MLRLTQRRRALLADTIRELANLGAAALVLGQFVGSEPLSSVALLAGIVLWFVFVGLALALAAEDEP